MPAIEKLGHVGLFCADLERMRDFYSQFLGLTISDEDLDRGYVFLSSNPKDEHHEVVLARARGDTQPTQFLQQLSFIVKSMEDLQAFYQQIKAKGLRVNRTVTHGNACSVYFYDPEDNLVEIYYRTGYNVRQPLNAPIDLEQPKEELLKIAKSFEAKLGPSLGAGLKTDNPK
jgi:catechol 2,3-dioxygenase-like lactoylglutathione lyase family enzyme